MMIISRIVLIFILFALVPTAEAASAEELAKEARCLGCHDIEKKLIGPSFKEIAGKYKGNPKATELLTERVIKGSSGIWGSFPMSPQSHVTPANAKKIIEWILNLSAPKTSAAPPTKEEAQGAFPEESGSVSSGKALFSGRKRFVNGGPSCISCHNVKGAGQFGGGELAVDLTETFSKYGSDALTSVLESPGFPLMKDIYANHPITKEEGRELVLFLSTFQGEIPDQNKGTVFLAGSFAGFLVTLLLMHFAWIKRKRLTRKRLVEES